MAHRLIWSTRATADLQRIAQYIKRDSAATAEIVLTKVTGLVRRLQRFPLSGRIVPEWEQVAYREIIVYDYRIIYKVGLDTASIITIMHARRRFPKRPPRVRFPS
ncbi:type II toxin-antitoxin system RelE/ParE family toxin [Longimicrobium sp.]|uniref:type II toxin-antitoxin system RelE/ParE family toxin n=1 Tax=Longimicrobium sp. TaxID=2029185 RepID=UPI002E323491|nr:type II toxin-antitoxin system RelE/ParE family toxin [Longimicrobium sp.]HEX6042230.1 type II toxin-antitoxin system RelE/ParE family toxin [Longimicrobium sp.]